MKNASNQNPGSADSPLRHLLKQTADIIPLARLAVKKPAVIAFILRATRRIQILAAITLICLLFVFPPLLNKGFNLIFPPKSSSKLFGIVKNEKKSKLAKFSYTFTNSAMWATAIGAFGLLFWLQIPAGVAAASKMARRRESAADEIKDSNPFESRQLFMKALALETDPERLTAIRDKLEMLDNKSSAATISDSKINSGKEILTDSDIQPNHKVSNLTPDVPEAVSDGRYLIEEQLGKGAMGVVYRATDTVLDRQIALKELPNRFAEDAVYVARFKREARALAKLSHPNIVQVYDLLDEKDRIWMTLEFLDGGDLAGYLKSNKKMSANKAIPLMIHVCQGLAYVHKEGIIHRDLKPSNILLTKEMVPKITDFGIARLTQATALTQEGSTIGTPQYMSPEQCTGGEIDKYTDIYALGITFYELLTGRVPFTGETSNILAQHVIQKPKPPCEMEPNIPPPVESLILKMLEKDPVKRIQNASDVLEELLSFREFDCIAAAEGE